MMRIQSADAVRVLAIFAVIVIHTTPFAVPSQAPSTRVDFPVVLDQLSRFAVPCLFILSGYFWAAKLASTQPIQTVSQRMASRIGMLFLVWTLFYCVAAGVVMVLESGFLGALKRAYWHILELNTAWFPLLLEGSKAHLWFLPSLIWCVAIATLFLARGLHKALTVFALALYAVGLLGGAYHHSAFGFEAAFNLRNGPFFGLVFFVTGYWLQQRGPRPEWFRAGLALFLAGSCAHLLELVFLAAHYATPTTQDFVLGTLLSGTGAAMVALSGHASLQAGALARTGPLVLGIYAVHYCVIDLVAPLAARVQGNVAWEVAHPFIIFAASVIAAQGLARHPSTRRFVM